MVVLSEAEQPIVYAGRDYVALINVVVNEYLSTLMTSSTPREAFRTGLHDNSKDHPIKVVFRNVYDAAQVSKRARHLRDSSR